MDTSGARERKGDRMSYRDEHPVPFFSAPPGHLPQGDYLNDRLVWRIRSFWTLICPSKFVFGTVTV